MRKHKRQPDYLAALYADHTFHVYNRTNNRETLFRDDNDRLYFLKQYKIHVAPYVYTLNYCLLDNHFHLLIRVKSEVAILELVQDIAKKELTAAHRKFLQMPEDNRSVHEVIERQFTRLFTSYAMYFNTKWKRSGNLFYRPFKRVAIKNEVHFTGLIYYIHSNPEKHKIFKDFTKYSWSSYQAFLSEKPTLLERAEVLAWFGGKEKFIAFHKEVHDIQSLANYLIED